MKQKKIFIGVGILAVTLLGVLTYVQSRVDAQSFRAQIEKTVLEKTGFPITIRGQVAISMLPTPTIYLPGVELHDTAGDTNTSVPALTVDMVSIRSSFLSFLSGTPDIAGITFERPVLEIQRSEENVVRWGWLGAPLLQGEEGQSFSIDVVDGSILYRNAKTDSEMSVKDINAAIVTGNQPQANGSLTLQDRVLQFNVQSDSAQAGGAVPITLSLMSDKKDSLTLEGTANFSASTPQINGKIALNSENILQWFQAKPEKSDSSLFAKISGSSEQQNTQVTAMPLSVTGDWAQSGTAVKITVSEFKGLNSAGAGVIDAEWTKETPRITSTFDFSAINYDYWRAFILAAIQNKELSKVSGGYVSGSSKENPLPDDVTFALAVNAKQVYFGGQVWENARFSATLDNAAITINQLDVKLPGESSLSLFGIISQSSTREMRFEGTMETQGKSMRQLFTVFDASALDLPEGELGNFYIRSNIYVAADQIRLSEADVQISELHLNGGLVAYYDTMPRFEAEVKLNNINFDYFRDTWRKQYTPREKETYFLQYDKSQNFNWLKKLRASVDFKVSVDKFRFLERDGDSASFRIFSQAGEFGIYNVRFNYPGSTLEAGFNLDVKGEKPFFNVMLNTDALDTKYFRMNADAEEKKTDATGGKKRWSEDLIDMGWMEGWRGAFDITIGKFTHRDWAIEDIKCRASLDNNSLGIQNLSMNYWRGKAQTSGSFYGGKVPGLSLSFTLAGVELQDMLQSLVKRDNINGRLNINGTLSTSGVNMLSWISQAEADFILNGQNVDVNGFNLQGVVDAVGVSRTAADVVNNVNLALVNGKTQMSVEGSLNVKAGMMRTPGLALKSGNINGNLAGEIKIIPWKIDITEVFQFPSMATEKVPVMTVQLTGPLEKPDMGVDTASLEAYVAKRLTGGSGK